MCTVLFECTNSAARYEFKGLCETDVGVNERCVYVLVQCDQASPVRRPDSGHGRRPCGSPLIQSGKETCMYSLRSELVVSTYKLHDVAQLMNAGLKVPVNPAPCKHA